MKKDGVRYFVVSKEKEYFVGTLTEPRENEYIIRRLTDKDTSEGLLKSQYEIGSYLGKIDEYRIYDWNPEGYQREDFDRSEQFTDINAETLAELLENNSSHREHRDRNFGKF